MRSHVLSTYAESLDQARRLVDDIPSERFAELPHDGAKHAGWVLSHLCVGSGLAAAVLGDDPAELEGLAGVPKAMAAASAPGTTPVTDRSAYVSRDELLAELSRVHALAADRFASITDEGLGADFPIEQYREFWPTVGSAAFYLMARHEQYHLGQLSAWRRAIGLPAAAS